MSHQSQFTDVPSGKVAAIVTYLEMRIAAGRWMLTLGPQLSGDASAGSIHARY